MDSWRWETTAIQAYDVPASQKPQLPPKIVPIRAYLWKSQACHVIVFKMRVLKNQLRQLQRFLRRRGSSPQDAEDLVQEAVVRLFAYTRKAGEVRNTEAFLTRTAMNLAVDLHRSSRRDRFEPEPVEVLELLDLGPAPDEVFAAEQRLQRMKEALDRVSRRTREVFFMHRLQGLSHAEIANNLGVTTSAVEKHIASALTILTIERQRE
jgi:RNA polymerase sigma factor (sigma-70 family)